MSNAATEDVRFYLETEYRSRLEGWTFHATRNGRPFVDASHGLARRGDADRLEYGADTIVHIASIAKLICAVAVVRFVEEWNEIAALIVNDGGPSKYVGDPRPDDDGLIAAVCYWGGPISLDTPIFAFLKQHLIHEMPLVGKVRLLEEPGLGVDTITIRELLMHRGGLRDKYYDRGLKLLKKTRESIKQEVNEDGRARFDLPADCAVILASDIVAKTTSYSNDGYTLLGALIEFNTGVKYAEWVKLKVFPHARFNDIARYPVDAARAAKYYGNFGEPHPGVPHPDYTAFSACGGYYGSPRALCDWLDAVMQAERFNNRPILNDPGVLVADWLGIDGNGFDKGPFDGFSKNGGTSVSARFPFLGAQPAGGTAARLAYMKSIASDDRMAVFAHSNEQTTSIDGLLDDGLLACRKHYYPQSQKPSLTLRVPTQGLFADRWMFASKTPTASVIHFRCEVQSQPGSSPATDWTNLLMRPNQPFVSGDIQILDMTGIFKPGAGQHKLRLWSDDGAMLFIDDRLAIDNDKRDSLRAVDSDVIDFPADGRELRIIWYNSGGPGQLYLQFLSGDPETATPVPEAAFTTFRRLRPPPL